MSLLSILDGINIDTSLSEAFAKSIQAKSVKKGTLLSDQTTIWQKAYFVRKGCLRNYVIDDKGKEHIFMFAPEGWILSDVESQVGNKPIRTIFVDAIEDSEVEIFDIALYNKLSATLQGQVLHPYEKLFRRIAVLQKRVIMLMSATALERYEDFLATYPNIVNRVPQRMIASYLGVTPEALSKIRGENAKRKREK